MATLAGAADCHNQITVCGKSLPAIREQDPAARRRVRVACSFAARAAKPGVRKVRGEKEREKSGERKGKGIENGAEKALKMATIVVAVITRSNASSAGTGNRNHTLAEQRPGF